MRKIVELNKFSIVYALVLFVQTELLVNMNRLNRVIKNFKYSYTLWFVIIIFIVSTIYFIRISRKEYRGKKYRMIVAILWIPYYVVFILLFAYFVPMLNPADDPGNGMGFIIIGLVVIEPFYIVLINLLSDIRGDATPI